MARTTIPAELVAINAIQGTLIADNAITAVHIATNAVSGTLIADNAVTSTHIAQNHVTATQIANNTITVVQLADNAVETDKINADAVTGAKIADDAIDSEHYTDGSIDTAHIGDLQVTAAKIGANAVTLAKMASLARGSILIGNSAADVTALSVGSNGQVLKSDGTDISWGTDSSNDRDGAATFNESGAAVDFRIEGDTEQNLFFVDGSADKIGIGTASPDYQLHIAGGGDFLVEDTGNGSAHIRLRSSNGGTATSNWKLKTGNNNYFYIDNDTGSAGTAIAIDNTGKVGIGETSPAAKLEISGDTTTWAGMSKIYLTDVNSNTSSRNWSIGNGGTAFGSLSFITSNAADGVPADSTGTAVMSMDGVNKRVGIGTGSPARALHVKSSGTNLGMFEGSNGEGIAIVNNTDGRADIIGYSDTAGAYNALTLRSGSGTAGVHLTTGGQVLIGHATSIANASLDDLEVGSGSGNTGMTIYSGTSNYGGIAFADGNTGSSDQYPGLLEYFHTDNALQFYCNAALKMRIMSDGEIVQGSSSLADTYAPLVNGVTGDALVVGRHSTSGSLGLWRTNTMEFKYYHNGQGYIMTFGSNGVMSGDFNDTSDVNLKENISSISDGTTVIKALRPVKFDWKASGKGNNQHGFIAQEVEKVLPDAVEGNDYVENETGLPDDEPAGNGKNMNSNAVLAHAVKAIQELEARIKVLEG